MSNIAFYSMKWCDEAASFFSVVGTEIFTSEQLHVIGLIGKDASSFIQILSARGAIKPCGKAKVKVKTKSYGEINGWLNRWKFTSEYKTWYERSFQNKELVVVRKNVDKKKTNL